MKSDKKSDDTHVPWFDERILILILEARLDVGIFTWSLLRLKTLVVLIVRGIRAWGTDDQDMGAPELTVPVMWSHQRALAKDPESMSRQSGMAVARL